MTTRIGIIPLAVVVLIACSPTTGRSDDKETKSTPPPASKSDHQVAFMGIMIEELSPALMSHISGVGHSGQGLIVVSVGADSPAEKAGVKVHDVLMTYDDQKLFVPDQLLKLIASDTPGRDVKLNMIRSGKQETATVHLGERSVKSGESWMHDGPHPRRWGNMGFPRAFWRGQQQHQSSDITNPHWMQFDAMTLKKLDKDRFHATISFSGKDGKSKRHEYEGTRDEIRQKIESDQELNPSERQHLLRALDVERTIDPTTAFQHDTNFDF